MHRRVFLLVMDSMGIGAMPDAAQWQDEGSDTLGAIRNHPAFDCPTLASLGLFRIDGVQPWEETHTLATPSPEVIGNYARMAEASAAKDTTVGHWEIAGLISEKPFPTFPEGFPPEVIQRFQALTGRGVLCNRPYSGTDVIRDFGQAHVASGDLIVYTSADSVFQIAAHEDVVPVHELYRYCELARQMLTGPYGVGRVIARPFAGEWPYTRTARRHDYSMAPTGTTALDLLSAQGKDVLSVGKIYDIFAGRGVTESHRTVNNDDGMAQTLAIAERDFDGLCFVNLVDFDMVYGHRNDVAGYAAAMTAFDRQLAQLLPKLRQGDLLMITADHGCDPSTPSTDHSREYTPLLLWGPGLPQGVNLGTRPTFADISATLLDWLGVAAQGTAGESLLRHLSPQWLMQNAEQARGMSYAPYSGFAVGAALLGQSGRVYSGCNIESASFSPTNCAERTALFKAVSEGERHFAAIAVVGGKAGEPGGFCAPCGVCRQMLAEFCPPDMPVYLGAADGDQSHIQVCPLGQLLPFAFTERDVMQAVRAQRGEENR